jgi:hypothetical protein
MLLAEPARHGNAFAIIGKRRRSPDQTAHGLQDNEWSTSEKEQAENLDDGIAGLQKVERKWNQCDAEQKALDQLRRAVWDFAFFAPERVEFRWFRRELMSAIAVPI